MSADANRPLAPGWLATADGYCWGHHPGRNRLIRAKYVHDDGREFCESCAEAAGVFAKDSAAVPLFGVDADLRGLQEASDAARERAESRLADAERLLGQLRAIFPSTIAPPDDDCADDDEPTCAKCGTSVTVEDDHDWKRGDVCHHCAQDAFAAARELLRGTP